MYCVKAQSKEYVTSQIFIQICVICAISDASPSASPRPGGCQTVYVNYASLFTKNEGSSESSQTKRGHAILVHQGPSTSGVWGVLSSLSQRSVRPTAAEQLFQVLLCGEYQMRTASWELSTILEKDDPK